MIYTVSELRAVTLLHGQWSDVDPHEAGNQIIELAERIKSERAIAAMGACQ